MLIWLLANEPEAGEELAREWLDEDAGLAAVSAASLVKLPKAGRKALRRVAHGARSRGIDLEPVDRANQPVVGRLPSLNESLEAA